MEQSIYRRRIVINNVGMMLSSVAMIGGLLGLAWILWTLFYNGLSALDYRLLHPVDTSPGIAGGGMANAIVGSLLMVGDVDPGRDAGRHPRRHLPRRVRRNLEVRGGHPFRRRHHAVGAVDRDRSLRLRAGGCHRRAFLRLGGLDRPRR